MDRIFKMAGDKAAAQLKKLPGKAIDALKGLPGALIGALAGRMASAGASIGQRFVNALIGAISGARSRAINIGSSIGAAAAAAAAAAASKFSGIQSWAPLRRLPSSLPARRSLRPAVAPTARAARRGCSRR